MEPLELFFGEPQFSRDQTGDAFDPMLVASGALAGLCAAMVVELCSFGLQWWWFDGQWQFHWAIWAGLPLLGALLVTLAGQGMRRQLLAGTLSDRLRGLGQGLL